jgi:hypothetical protein
MNKAIVFLIILVLGAPCFAQSSDEVQLVLGTWRNVHRSETITFNSNGTYTQIVGADNYNGHYFISDKKLIRRIGNDILVGEIIFSSNGRSFVLFGRNGWAWFEKL